MSDKLWKYLPASLAHRLAPIGLAYFAAQTENFDFRWKPFQWKGLYFPNRLGIAGGVDKNGEHLLTWQKLGAGFVEVGTVTPYSQNANPGKVIDRDWEGKNLWNKMGFPNHGADEVYYNIKNSLQDLSIPVFVNIGKNRHRAIEEAEIDYAYLAERFSKIAGALVINISSPNTQGLRSLQSPEFIKSLLIKVKSFSLNTPVLVKLSPDMSEADFYSCLDSALINGADGFILTNTTLSRPGNCRFPKEGGVSGLALAELSKKHLKMAVSHLGHQKSQYLICSVGGILSPKDVQERLDLGADLTQSYAGIVFHGPTFFRDVAGRMK